jgi:hypothetical protein
MDGMNDELIGEPSVIYRLSRDSDIQFGYPKLRGTNDGYPTPDGYREVYRR